MTDVKVSIVIPVYNGDDFLAEAIDSALAQTYQNIEVIVVNDGSNDDGKTESVALSYGDKIRYFSQPNGGVASALNRAIDEASGDYISWLSHDDLYTADKVSKEMDALLSIGRDDVIIYCDYSVFTDDSEKSLAVRLKGVPAEQFRYWITVENKLHGCALLIPKRAFEQVGGFNEALRTTQDYDLWFRMAKVFNFVHIPELLVKARSHSEQGSIKMSEVALRECNALLSSFVTDLSSQELISATGTTLAESYEKISVSMFQRGFTDVGTLAENLAIQNDKTGNYKATLKMNYKKQFTGNFLTNMARKYLPPKIKQMIKSLIRPVVSHSDNNTGQTELLKNKFSDIYENNIFGGQVSRSGEGSDFVQTEVIRQQLPKIIKDYSIQSFLDAPCGDWYWMKETELGVKEYIGVDIVESLIEKNTNLFGNSNNTFLCLNLAVDPLPKVDMIFSRDCLVHLNFEDALHIINNFKKSGSKYLLTTSFSERKKNNDLVGVDNFWRPLNMTLAPFNFPEPIIFINEKCTEEAGGYTDKGLGLWLLSEINI